MGRFATLVLLLLAVYAGSYVAFRQTNREVWPKDQQTYVIFPSGTIGQVLYYFWRPLSYADSALSGIRFLFAAFAAEKIEIRLLTLAAAHESVRGTLSPSRHAVRGCLLMRCYGGSDGENRIDRQIINRAMAPSPISTQPDGAIDAQAKKAA